MKAKILLLAATVAVGAASANLIGNASIGFGQVGVSVYGTDFFSFGSNGQCNQPGTGAGCFDLVSGTGSFASHTNFAPQTNSIKDLPSPPLSGAIAIATFISFDNGAILFDLTSVWPGGGQNCATAGDLSAANLSCTIYVDYGTPASPNVQVSPYVLTNGPDGDTVSIAATMYLNGYLAGDSADVTKYIGIFSTQMAGVNIAAIYDVISQGGTAVNAWSASFSPITQALNSQTAPEPYSILLSALGIAGLALRKLTEPRR